jgi:hypothetical protein
MFLIFKDSICREKLAQQQILREEMLAAQTLRYHQLADALRFEKDAWITAINLESKVNADLFKKPTTTGLVTKFSNYWRYHILPIDIDRFINSDDFDHFNDSSIAARLNDRAQLNLTQKLLVQDFLEPMIDSGETRDKEKYQKLVDEFTDVLKYLNKDDNSNLFDNDVSSIISMFSCRKQHFS